jgi:hypothetical protein
VLGRSLAGLEIPYLHVGEHQQGEGGEREKEGEGSEGSRGGKKNVVVSGRIHPGESNGSHMVNGLLAFLLGDSP